MKNRHPLRLIPPVRSIISFEPPDWLTQAPSPLVVQATELLPFVMRPEKTHEYLKENRVEWSKNFDHPLSEYLPYAPPLSGAERSIEEASALLSCQDRFSEARTKSNPKLMRDALLDLARLLEPSATRLRCGKMMLRSNVDAPIIMPNAFDATRAFDALARSLATPPAFHPFGLAVWHHARILNAHALPDANGRLARAVFNLELQWAGMRPNSYVPLYSIMRLCRGGFELRLREAELFDRWSPLAEFLAHAVRVATLAPAGREQ